MPAELDRRGPAAPPEVGCACAICQTKIAADEDVGACPGCRGPYHAECWAVNGGCAAYGCAHAPEAPDDPGAGEAAPVTAWGKEEKQCPRCEKAIKIAARRCRHCGQLVGDGAEVGTSSLPPAQAGNGGPVLLLLAGALPFTAPLVLLFAGPWLWLRWRAVRR